MAAFDDELTPLPTAKATHEVGQDLSRLSVAELRERIGLLQGELARLEREIAAKGSHKSAADQLFKL